MARCVNTRCYAEHSAGRVHALHARHVWLVIKLCCFMPTIDSVTSNMWLVLMLEA
jgi:hypothetical protein